MFNNIGKKIKTLSVICFIIMLVVVVIYGIIMMRLHVLIGLLIITVGFLFSWISSFFVYGFGELIASQAKTNENMHELLYISGLVASQPTDKINQSARAAPLETPETKVIAVDVNKQPQAAETAAPERARTPVVLGGGANVESLLKRAYMFLEDGQWDSAEEYCEMVLDLDPENALAYLGKLMAVQHVHCRNDLENLEKPFNTDGNYQKAIRFGDDALVTELEGYLNHIKTRNEKDRVTGIYNQASAGMKSATTESSYKYAAQLFQSISGFRDADELSKECFEKAESCRKDSIYASAKAKMELDRKENYEEAIRQLETIPEWNDADELISECRDKIDRITAELLIQEETEKNKALEKKKAAKKKRIIIIIFAIALLACITLVVVNIINRSQLPEPAEPTPAPTTAPTGAPTVTPTTAPEQTPAPAPSGNPSEGFDLTVRDWPSEIVVLVDALRIRQTPSTTGEAIGMTERGQHYYPFDSRRAEGYTWYKIGQNEWIADDNGKYVSAYIWPDYEVLIEQAKGRNVSKDDPSSFVGHTIAEVIEVFGEGYSLEDFGDSGPYPGLYYEDGRTEYAFIYCDRSGIQTGTVPLYSDYIVLEARRYSALVEEARQAQAEYLDMVMSETINSDYYSITVPGRISGKYTVQQYKDYLALYENTSMSDGAGGKFFNLQMYEATDFGFLDNPTIADFLGMLTTRSGEQFYLFLGQDTDVQWSERGREDFFACSDCTEDILASLYPCDGVTLAKPENLNPESKQVVFVDHSMLYVAEWSGSKWITRLSDTPAAIGSNGTTASKREGDHCTPSGTFNILFCFSDQALETNLRQKYITEGDVWVADQSSRYYNTIQPDSASYKDWSKSENIYRQFTSGKSYAGILFDYNGDGESADSATPGAGAALFLDGIGSSGDLYTGYGDIKISGPDMKRLLKVLDQSLNPTIIIRAAG